MFKDDGRCCSWLSPNRVTRNTQTFSWILFNKLTNTALDRDKLHITNRRRATTNRYKRTIFPSRQHLPSIGQLSICSPDGMGAVDHLTNRIWITVSHIPVSVIQTFVGVICCYGFGFDQFDVAHFSRLHCCSCSHTVMQTFTVLFRLIRLQLISQSTC